MKHFAACCLCQLEFFVNEINQWIYDKRKISKTSIDAPWIRIMPDWAERELSKDP